MSLPRDLMNPSEFSFTHKFFAKALNVLLFPANAIQAKILVPDEIEWILFLFNSIIWGIFMYLILVIYSKTQQVIRR